MSFHQRGSFRCKVAFITRLSGFNVTFFKMIAQSILPSRLVLTMITVEENSVVFRIFVVTYVNLLFGNKIAFVTGVNNSFMLCLFVVVEMTLSSGTE